MKAFIKKWWPAFVLFGFAIIFCSVSCTLLILQKNQEKVLDNTMQALALESEADKEEEPPVIQENTSATTESETTEPEDTEDTPAAPDYVSPYQSYFDENEDMIAWLQIPDTIIDYPVMQTMSDENYYLKRDFNKNSNSNGSLIMDTDSDVLTPGTNLIIHGHNMKSGEMFGSLQEYKKEDYYKEHPLIYLYVEDEQRAYEVLSVFYSQVFKKTDTDFKYYAFFQANTEEEFNDFYGNIKSMALYDTGVEASFGDCFLTLSTCSYQVDRGRFVVIAKQIPLEDVKEQLP